MMRKTMQTFAEKSTDCRRIFAFVGKAFFDLTIANRGRRRQQLPINAASCGQGVCGVSRSHLFTAYFLIIMQTLRQSLRRMPRKVRENRKKQGWRWLLMR